MAFDVINVGTINQGDGDTLRAGGVKINNNFAKAVEKPASAPTNNRMVVFDGVDGQVKQAAFEESDVGRLTQTQTFSGAKTFSGVVELQNQVRVTPGANLGATGTLTVDFSAAALRSTDALTDAITWAGSNYAAGRTVTVRVVNGGTTRAQTFDAAWVFVGAKPSELLANKTAILTLTAFGTTAASVVAAWAAQE
jgi:hypothetical protein